MIAMSRSMLCGRVGREAQDVARVGQHLGALPRLQHLAVFGDAILTFRRALETVGIDVLEPDENLLAPRAHRLLDEVRNFVAHRVHLHDEVYLQVVAALEFDDAIEDRFPIFVAREIVVGDKETLDALRRVRANQMLDVVGAAIARFAPLHIYDRAEAATERASAPRVEASERAGVALDVFHRQERQRLAFHPRQIRHEVVHR